MALKGTIFGFYGTKSLRKNYNIGKKCIITIRFKVFFKKWKNGKKFNFAIFEFFAIFSFFEETLKPIFIIHFLPIL